MQPFHTIDVYEMCGEVVLSQGVILSAHCAPVTYILRGKPGKKPRVPRGRKSGEGENRRHHPGSSLHHVYDSLSLPPSLPPLQSHISLITLPDEEQSSCSKICETKIFICCKNTVKSRHY